MLPGYKPPGRLERTGRIEQATEHARRVLHTWQRVEAVQTTAAWRDAVDALPVIVFTAGADGSIDFVNRQWTAFSGWEPEVLLGTGWSSVVAPKDRERVFAETRRGIRAGVRFTVDFRCARAAASDAWLSVTLSPLRVTGGTAWCGTAVDTDASHQMQAALCSSQADLADSERRFRALAEAIPVICWTADAGGWIDWYNHRWYEFTGQRVEDALGWGWQAAHHPDDFLQVMRSWPHSIVSGEPFEMEHRLRRYDGRFSWFLTRVEPLRGPDGGIERWYGSNVDIDAHKVALERTKRVAETFQDMFLPKALPHTADMRFDAVYRSAEREALVGGDWYDAFELPDGTIVISIGDVAGHGIEASMSAGRHRQAIFTLAFDSRQPDEILSRLDAMIEHQEPGVLVTALVAFIDPERTEMRYATAGHPPPLIAYRQGEPAHVLPSGGTPLGTGLAATFETHAAPLRRDAVVACYTDGMLEFARDVFSAEERLRTAVALLVGDVSIARPAAAVQAIVFDDKPARDDAALLIAQFSPVDPDGLRSDPSRLARSWRFHSSDAYTVHASRREIVSFLRALAADPEELFACELILGEILANTVEHAPGLVEVRVDWTGEKPIAIVRDTGPGLRSLVGRLPDDVLSEGGRGIFLINELAEEVTVRPTAGYGTEITAVLPLRRKPA